MADRGEDARPSGHRSSFAGVGSHHPARALTANRIGHGWSGRPVPIGRDLQSRMRAVINSDGITRWALFVGFIVLDL